MRFTAICLAACLLASGARSEEVSSETLAHRATEILQQRCVSCHSDSDAGGGFSLSTRESLLRGGDSGSAISLEESDVVLLVEMIVGEAPEMPKDGEPLSAEEIAVLRQWVQDGAPWPESLKVLLPPIADTDWWSLRPLTPPAVPKLSKHAEWIRTPIDAFVLAKLQAHQLAPSGEADRVTLIRRLYFDLLGLPPTYQAVEEFVHDSDPLAYERLVDELLESPHYGERWARHWLDVVHYGDTHGYDKDKPRPHAWPYRDYVIQSFNDDKPYWRFVQEQIAGDVLWPESADSMKATGFIAAGPWDFIGHAEVPETKTDGKIARHLDRDDMVTSTMNTFCSLTVQCARCHHHKFDPVSQEQYYSLQAVFSALDRADRAYDDDPDVARERGQLIARHALLQDELENLEQQIEKLGGASLLELEQQIEKLELSIRQGGDERPEYGYHSQIVDRPDVIKWVQVDLGKSQTIQQIVMVSSRDDFAGIGEGFGFPKRFKIEAATDAKFTLNVRMLHDATLKDFENPGCEPLVFEMSEPVEARFVRITATRLSERQNDYIFALGELEVIGEARGNLALGRSVTALDSIEAPVRWGLSNLVDGYYVGKEANREHEVSRLSQLQETRYALRQDLIPSSLLDRQAECKLEMASVVEQLDSLPAQSRVYCGTVYTGSGAFRGTGHDGGRPREIRVLARGNMGSPGKVVSPGTVPIIPDVDWQFDLPSDHAEGDRRAALARWLTRGDHPLTWRSIVNRVWGYHFGRGLVDSPNDFGRMGQLPSHPELLDWLAAEFRDNGQSLKQLHRMIVCSSVYRQASYNKASAKAVDAENRFLWRMNRRVLDAESVRDSILLLSGKLRTECYGPPFRDFVMENPEHSPHYQYHLHDPNDPATHRRSIYRFLVRSQQQPLMQTLDCADPSESVSKRGTTLTALQALAMLNNKLVVRMSEHFAARVRQEADYLPEQVAVAYQDATSRAPSSQTLQELIKFGEQFGLEHVCRVILNLNAFMFVD